MELKNLQEHVRTLATLAEREGCTVEVVEQSDKLTLLGGVGCLLRYRLPEEYT